MVVILYTIIVFHNHVPLRSFCCRSCTVDFFYFILNCIPLHEINNCRASGLPYTLYFDYVVSIRKKHWPVGTDRRAKYILDVVESFLVVSLTHVVFTVLV